MVHHRLLMHLLQLLTLTLALALTLTLTPTSRACCCICCSCCICCIIACCIAIHCCICCICWAITPASGGVAVAGAVAVAVAVVAGASGSLKRHEIGTWGAAAGLASARGAGAGVLKARAVWSTLSLTFGGMFGAPLWTARFSTPPHTPRGAAGAGGAGVGSGATGHQEG